MTPRKTTGTPPGAFLAVAILIAILIWLCGCTITPAAPTPRKVATYDENDLNGGIITAIYNDHHTFQGFAVTDGFVARYNSYAKDYGYLFHPVVEQYHPAGNIFDAAHMVLWKDLEAQPGLGKKPQSLLQKVGL